MFLSIIFDNAFKWVHTADSRPKLIAGSSEGYLGHVDGKPREARMNQPKGLAVDDKGNIYIADTENMAIRKISDSGKIIYIYLYIYMMSKIALKLSLPCTGLHNFWLRVIFVVLLEENLQRRF